jgi:prepilin-type N-terminal cleavage/methylation domain-containing protein
MKRQEGFSLLELLMVVTIIGIISVLAIPGLRKARQYATSGSAIQSLRTITTAEHLYERRYHTYAALIDLAPEGSLATNLAAGVKSEYIFAVTLTTGSSGESKFTCTATPEVDAANSDYFFVDETAVIRFNSGAPADVTSTPIPR